MTDSIAPLMQPQPVVDKTSIENDVTSIKNAEHVELALCHTVPAHEGRRNLPVELFLGMEIAPTVATSTLATNKIATTATTTTITTTTAGIPVASILTSVSSNSVTDQIQNQTETLDKNVNTRWGRMLRVLSRCIVYCSVRIAAGFGISRQQSGWYKHCWDTPGRRAPDFGYPSDAANQSANSGMPGDSANVIAGNPSPVWLRFLLI